MTNAYESQYSPTRRNTLQNFLKINSIRFYFIHRIAMRLSAAEKQRLYRARQDADPERRQIYLETERLSWKKKQSTWEVNQIIELSERAKRSVRKWGRNAQRTWTWDTMQAHGTSGRQVTANGPQTASEAPCSERLTDHKNSIATRHKITSATSQDHSRLLRMSVK